MEHSETPIAEVLSAVEAWWRTKRPFGWDRRKHLKEPTVNCIGASERDLAHAIAYYITARQHPRSLFDN